MDLLITQYFSLFYLFNKALMKSEKNVLNYLQNQLCTATFTLLLSGRACHPNHLGPNLESTADVQLL